MATMIDAKVEYQRILTAKQDGWIDLPCGGSILIEGGKPTTASDSGRNAPIAQLLREASEALGRRIVVCGSAKFTREETITPVKEVAA